MQDAKHIRRQRLKLILIFAIFAAPMVAAWGMVEFRIGIPDQHTAHGKVDLELPVLNEWPLALSNEPGLDGPELSRLGLNEPGLNELGSTETRSAVNGQEEWILAFDCTQQCEQRKDEFWRLHRALGREAPRLIRLRIGGDSEPLPGEMTSEWRHFPPWREDNSVWLLDPMGRPALSFEANVATKYVLDDIRHLLKVNPQ
ncbi:MULTISPECIES: hypothetical protein [unclassified Halomonas]|uniref:hypothetical protein n=1 Tax=unclassified Halomonas TaxID=2609666 RepID=UPI0007DA0963|nr:MULTISPECIES: hypothetical protein [unclassified Halomonas]MBT2788898.1 hypothetical protein [Halomonas sp. ISL-106]MBT2795535.1 hypothetical protein [Halomonas sp. ISL-104]OAL60356.1 hypothetical protein A6R74_20200 [Halomonas sp. ALS9]